MELIVIIGVLIVGGVLIQNYRRRKRREYLMSKYNDALLVDLIMSKKIRQGMTIEQLVESWGRPVDVDEKVYKTKTKYTYKYNQVGKNRFRERVYVENGSIVGWEERG